MFSGKKKQIDMVSGPLFLNIIRFAVPVMLSNLLEIAFHTADTVIVGRFCGQKALAAVGAAGPVTIFFIWGFSGISVGVDVLVARMLGKKDDEAVRKAVHSAFFVALTGGILMSLAGIFGAPYMARGLGVPEDIIADTIQYLRIYFLIGVPFGFYIFGSAVYRASGETKKPTLFLAFSGACNVALNLLFVAVFHLGVFGVAAATFIAELLSGILNTVSLMREDSMIRLRLSEIRGDGYCVGQILRIGVPSALQNMLFSVSNLVVQATINSYGSVVVAANAAANAVEEYVYICVDSFPKAVVSFTGQNAGAGNSRRIPEILRAVLLLTAAGSFAIGYGSMAAGKILLSWFTDNPEVIRMGMYRLRYVTLYLFLNGLIDDVVGSIRGMGSSLLPTLITLSGICGFRLLYIRFWCGSHPGLDQLYLCFPYSWLITLAAQVILWCFVWKKFRESEEENTAAG